MYNSVWMDLCFLGMLLGLTVLADCNWAIPFIWLMLFMKKMFDGCVPDTFLLGQAF